MLQSLRSFVPWGVVLLLICEAILITASFLLAYAVVLEVDPWTILLYDWGLGPLILVVLSLLTGFYFVDLYTNLKSSLGFQLLQQLVLVIGGAYLVQAVVGYISRSWILPETVMMLGSLLSFFLVATWRVLYARFVLQAVASQRVLLLGTSPFLQEIAQHLREHPEMGYSVAGYIHDVEDPAMTAAVGPWLGTPANLRQQVARTQPAQLIANLPYSEAAGMPFTDLLELRFQGVVVEDMATAYERLFGRVLIADLSVTELLFPGRLGPSPATAQVQALLSIGVAIIGILLTWPLMLLTALAVRFTSAGPVLFRQVRLGLNGTPYKVFKFRSMYVGSDRFTGPRKGDPRITPVGVWIRRLRLDELPQFFNVLRGEMLMVGPRPELPEFTEVFVQKLPLYRYRLLVKPGITGWAQIHHQLEYELEDTVRKLSFDLYYLKRTSIVMDLYVMFHTIKIMLLSRGAR